MTDAKPLPEAVQKALRKLPRFMHDYAVGRELLAEFARIAMREQARRDADICVSVGSYDMSGQLACAAAIRKAAGIE